MDDYLTVQEVAHRLKIRPKTIYNQQSKRNNGEPALIRGVAMFECVKIGGRLMVHKDTLDRWLELLHPQPSREETRLANRFNDYVKHRTFNGEYTKKIIIDFYNSETIFECKKWGKR